MVEVGIRRVVDDGGYVTDEYTVYWKSNGVYDEDKAYYTDSIEDAAGTLVMVVNTQREQGVNIVVSRTQQTMIPLAKFHRLFADNELKRRLNG